MYKFKKYSDSYYDFVYKVKKEVYKNYVEENFGKWDEEIQKEYFDKFILSVKESAYIIEFENKDIGFYNGKILDDKYYEIGNICIKSEYQGKGIGTKILQDIIKNNSERIIKLQYFKQNPVGKLYEKLGFVLVGETEYHYQMEKKTNEENILGKFIKSEANPKNKYYRVIQFDKEYNDGKKFPIDKVVVSEKKVDINAIDRTQIGGFYISTYEYIFRWLIRGDTLCEVKIPEDSKIYETKSENGIYLSDKIILTNPKRIDDNFAMELYLNSKLSEKSYFITIAVCAICGYINTALKVLNDKVNIKNVDLAIEEFEAFCKRREEEYNYNCFEIEIVKKVYEKLNQMKDF